MFVTSDGKELKNLPEQVEEITQVLTVPTDKAGEFVLVATVDADGNVSFKWEAR